MIPKEVQKLAAQMLGIKEENLPLSLVEILLDLDKLTCRVGGEIRSRQIVALAIVMWQNKNEKT